MPKFGTRKEGNRMLNYDYLDIACGEDIPKTSFKKKRDIYLQLKKYMDQPYEAKICALYGLRRTGKTVMMWQCVGDMTQEEREKSCYILCRIGSDILDIRRAMSELMDKGIKNFFIDEITYADGFLEGGNVLSDYYAARDCKVVIAGTDSLGIRLAETDILYDRVNTIHTSIIPFAEFSRLLGTSDISQYIEYGGLLTDRQYKTLQDRDQYINTAIVGNILNSLEKSEEMRYHRPALTELYKKEELASTINKLLNKFSYTLTVKAICKYFRSAPLYATLRNIKEDTYIKYLDDKNVNHAVKEALGIKDELETNLTQQHLKEIKDYLEQLDLFLKIPCYQSLKNGIRQEDLEIILQPGMVYAQAEVLIQELSDNQYWNDLCQIEDRERFIERADQFVKGELLENIILAETYQYLQMADPKRYYVSQLSLILPTHQNAEADMLCVDKKKGEVYVFEIKHSSQRVKEQARHLTNPEFGKYIEANFGRIKMKAILYLGPDYHEKDIDYFNAEKFLKKMDTVKRKKMGFERIFLKDEKRIKL